MSVSTNDYLVLIFYLCDFFTLTRFDMLRGAPDAHAIAEGLISRNTVGKLSWTVALGGLAILLIGLARGVLRPCGGLAFNPEMPSSTCR